MVSKKLRRWWQQLTKVAGNRLKSQRRKQAARTLLFLEALEDRTLLSLGGVPQWLSQGPGPINSIGVGVGLQAGAIEAIAVDPKNASRIFVATVNGGVWSTNDAQDASPHWTALTDRLPSLSVADVEFSPLDPTRNTLYASMGVTSSEGIGGPNAGIYVTTDGGSNWFPFGLGGQNLAIYTIIPTAVVSFGGQVFLAGTNQGLYRSVDGGSSWTLMGGAGDLPKGAAISTIKGDPGNSAEFYAAVPGLGVYRSRDTGGTWIQVLSAAGSDNIKVAVSHNNFVGADPVYASVDVNSHLANVYRSADTGSVGNNQTGTWNPIGLSPPGVNLDPAGNAFTTIVADPSDPNIVFVAGDTALNIVGDVVQGNASTGTWTPFPSLFSLGTGGFTAPHADSRAMVFDSNGDLLQSNDGGLYRLVNPDALPGRPTRTWVPMDGDIRDSEFYQAAYDAKNQVLVGGTQDNGTPLQSAPGALVWSDIGGGDGGGVAVDTNGGVYYFADVTLEHDGGTVPLANGSGGGLDSGLSLADQQSVAVPADGYFPIVLNPQNQSRMLLGINNVYESTTQGAVITQLTLPAMTGKVTDLNYGTDNANAAYVGTSTGQLFVRASAGASFSLSTFNNVAIGNGSQVNRIIVDPTNWQIAYVLDANNRVWRTIDAGATLANWTNLTGNLALVASANTGPGTTNIKTLELYAPKSGTRVLLAGGLGGVYRLLDTKTSPYAWDKYGSDDSGDIPNVLVTDLRYYPGSDLLVAATFGRGVWTVTNASATLTTRTILQVNATGGNDVIQLSHDFFNPAILDVYINNQLIQSVALAELEQIQIIGVDPDNSLLITSSWGNVIDTPATASSGTMSLDNIPLTYSEIGTVTYDGQGAGDSLTLQGGGFSQETYSNFQPAGNLQGGAIINLDGATIIYAGLGVVTDLSAVSQVTFSTEMVHEFFDMNDGPVVKGPQDFAGVQTSTILPQYLTYTGDIPLNQVLFGYALALTPIDFANKTNVVLVDDFVIRLDTRLRADGLTSVTINPGTSSSSTVPSTAVIQSTVVTTTVTTTAQGYSDVVIHSTRPGVGVQDIHGMVIVSDPIADGQSTLEVDDSGDPNGKKSVSIGRNEIINLAPTEIRYDNTVHMPLTVTGGGGGNQFHLAALGDPFHLGPSLTLNTGSGSDQIFAQGIGQPYSATVDGGAGYNILDVLTFAHDPPTNSGGVVQSPLVTIYYSHIQKVNLGSNGDKPVGWIDLSPPSFNNRSPVLSGGGQPVGAAMGDFNADGIPDLAIANAGSTTLSLMLGNGDGTFHAPISVQVGSQPAAMITADFTGGGIPDFAVLDPADHEVRILLGNGDGTFQSARTDPTGAMPSALVMADFNSDGVPDLAITNSGDNTVTILLGNGDGSFRALPTGPIAVGSQPMGIVEADVNADGIPDLAVTNAGRNTVTVLLGNGDGTFHALSTGAIPVGASPRAIATADFNGDSTPDLAVANYADNTLTILLGNGDGTFTPAVFSPIRVGSHPVAVVAADFNADLVPDLAVANSASNNVSVLLGNGDGTFTPEGNSPFAVGSNPQFLAVADLNHSGTPDLVDAETNAANGAGAVRVLLNTAHAPIVVQDGFTITAEVGQPDYDVTVAAFTTPNLNSTVGDYTATITWGSGAVGPGTIVSTGPGSFQVRGTILYSAAGQYAIGVTINEANGRGAASVATANVAAAGTIQLLGDTTSATDDTIVLRLDPANEFLLQGVVNGLVQFDISAYLTLKVSINGWAGFNTINIQDIPASVSVTSSDGAGGVTNVGSSGGLQDILGSLIISDGAANSALNINDQAATTPVSYVIGSTVITRTSAGTITWSGVNSVTVNCGSGGNAITVLSTGVPLTVNAGANDNIAVGAAAGLNFILGKLTINGRAGFDFLTLNDQENTGANVYDISANSVSRPSSPNTAPIIYNSMLGLVLNAGSLTYGSSIPSNTVVVNNTAANTQVIINAGSGDDGMGGGNTLIGPGNVNAALGGGIDATAPSVNTAWNITGTNAGFFGNVNFTNVANLVGGAGLDSFRIQPAGSVATLDGGGGGDWLDYSAFNNAVTVNLTTGSATGIGGGFAGAVRNIQNVRGGAGNDNLTGNPAGGILIGGLGNDVLTGANQLNAGRNILIGDSSNSSIPGGGDHLTGGPNDDILIAGVTSFEGNFSIANQLVLATLLQEWQRTDLTFGQRIEDLEHGGGLNGTNLLQWGVTVLNFGAADTLVGNPPDATGQDWFFVNGPSDPFNTILDYHTGDAISPGTPTVTLSDAGGPYSGSAYPASAGATGWGGTQLNGSFSILYYIGSSATGSGATSAPVNVGTYTAVASFTSSDPNYFNGVSNPVTFTIRSATHLAITNLSLPFITAGGTFTFSVTAEDSSGLPVPGYAGTVQLTSTDGNAMFNGGVLPATYTFNAADAGAHDFAVSLTTAGSTTITVTDLGNNSLTATTVPITVIAGPLFKKFVVALPAGNTVVAGVPFLFTVQATDSYGNPVSGYFGPTTVMTVSEPADIQSNFPISGALQISSLGFGFFQGTLATAGTYVLTTSALGYSGVSGAVTVVPARAAYFQTVVSTSVVTGTPFNVTVTAFDQYNNIATGYTGPVSLSSTDASASLGKKYLFRSGPGLDNGVHNFSVTLLTPGSQTITATDTAGNPIIPGTSSPFTAAGLQVTTVVGNPTGFTVNFNKPFDLTTLKLYGTTVNNPGLLFYMTNNNVGPAELTGSVVPNATDTAFTFVETNFGDQNGGLPNGVYDVSLLAGRASDRSPGLRDTNGTPLDASNSPNSSPNLYSTLLGQALTAYSTSFTLSTASAFTDTTQAAPTQVAVSLPTFAQGPGLPVHVQVHNSGGAGGTYPGIPATISDGNHASTVSFSVTYNTAMLTVTGSVVDPSILSSNPHATFSRTATGVPAAGIETDTFTFSTGDGSRLSMGSGWTLGDITASVPNTPGQQIYKSKQLLTVSNITSDGAAHGGVTNANLAGGSGFEVVAYMGDASGDGNIQLNDATLSNNVDNPLIGGGFPAYTKVDPVVLADTDGAGFVDSSSVGNIASLAIGHAQPTIPTPPAGRITSSGGADPDLSLPGQVTAQDGLVEVPVNLDNAMPAGSTGLTEATLDLTYDPRFLIVSASDVHLGSLPSQGNGWTVSSVVNQAAGQLVIQLYSMTPLTVSAAGSLVIVDFHVSGENAFDLPLASHASPLVSLADWANPTGQVWFRTSLADANGALTLGNSTGQATTSGEGRGARGESSVTAGYAMSEPEALARDDSALFAIASGSDGDGIFVRAGGSGVPSDPATQDSPLALRPSSLIFGNAPSINVQPLITPFQLLTAEVFGDLGRPTIASDDQGLMDHGQTVAWEPNVVNDQVLEELFAMLAME